jgi:hypothetical protein
LELDVLTAEAVGVPLAPPFAEAEPVLLGADDALLVLDAVVEVWAADTLAAFRVPHFFWMLSVQFVCACALLV